MYKGKLYLLLILTSSLLIACSKDSSKANENPSIEDTINDSLNETATEDTSKKDISKDDTSEENSSKEDKEDTSNENVSEEDTSKENTSEDDSLNEDTSDEDPSIGIDTTKGSISGNTDISQKVKDYILNGQGDKPEADKIKWSEAFLDQLNIEDLYQDYLTNDGNGEDIHEFALYLTFNAPIPDNWKDLVAADLLKNYDVEISRIEQLEGDLYQIYVEIDGKEVPYVVANARTGYYHG